MLHFAISTDDEDKPPVLCGVLLYPSIALPGYISSASCPEEQSTCRLFLQLKLVLARTSCNCERGVSERLLGVILVYPNSVVG